MQYGYWMPVFGGWLRNVDNENMEATWDYVKKLAIRSEENPDVCTEWQRTG